MLIYNQIGQRTRTFKGLVVLEDSLYLTPESEDTVFLTQHGSVNLVQTLPRTRGRMIANTFKRSDLGKCLNEGQCYER